MSMLDISQVIIPINKIAELDVSEPGKHYVAYLDNGRLVKISEIVERLLFYLQKENSLSGVASAMMIHSINADASELEEFIMKEMVPPGLVQLSGAPTQKGKRGSYLWLHLRVLHGSRFELLAKRLTFLFEGRFPLAVLTLAIAGFMAAAIRGDLFSFHTADVFSTNSAIILAILLFSCLMHELGHVVSCYHYGLTPGYMGFGFYMLRPVLFTDMSDGWQLNRKQRSVTSLAGMYFQVLMLVPLSVWVVLDTGNPLSKLAFLLVAGATLSNLNPFLRFDGYWIVTDLMGMPNIHFRVREMLKHFFLRKIGRHQSDISLPIMKSPIRELFFVYASLYVVATVAFIGVGVYMVLELLIGNFSILGLLEPIQEILSAQTYAEFAQRLNGAGLVVSFFFMIMYMVISLSISLLRGLLKSKTTGTKAHTSQGVDESEIA
ncbi:MAG: hypothetical protein ACYDGS_00760 [Thermoleophilia bacterium]